MPTLMLIDGNSLTYRAFHALPPDLATSSGQITNAVLGFTSMLINLVRDHKPDGIAVAFDRPEPTFRHEKVTTYKANREKTPDVLRQQMGLVRQVLEAVGLPIIEMPGFEADDIIATLATQAANDKITVLVVTGDRDSYQLVSDPYIRVIYNKRGVSDYANYDEAGILERTGVPPEMYVQYAAMRGDNSDNLPGVPGVGEKTAARLLMKYGGIDGIFDHIDEQTPKLRENLKASEDLVRLNLIVMDLIRDMDLDVTPRDLINGRPYNVDAVKEVFDFLEFRTMWGRFQEAFGPGDGEALPDHVEAKAIDVRQVKITDDAIAELAKSETPIAVAAALDGFGLGGLAIVTDADAGEVAWVPASDLELIANLVGPDGPGLATHDSKPLLRALLATDDAILVHVTLDTALAAYLLDPAGSSYPLEQLLKSRTPWCFPSDDGPPEGQLDFGDHRVTPALTACREALAVAHLTPGFLKALDESGLTELNQAVEVPLVRVLAKMEHVGVGVDRAELESLNATMAAEVDSLRIAICEDAGEDFNVNSTKKLQEILFEKLELTPGKKNKSGYSTNQATLEKLVGEHPIIDKLLSYREVEKLRSTYGQSLLASVESDDRIRATFNQTVARTGRLSSENPNLHNIPVRSDRGRGFRKAFVPAKGTTFLVADYNQIELRCIAHLANDPGMVEAFSTGEDIHRSVASRVFGVEPEEVDFEQRSKAKMVSYGLAYGMEAYGLGQRLGIATREAAEILDAFFEGFPAVRSYMDATVTEARNRGYTETLFGRRRAIPELMSDNRLVRQAGERQAMNAGIQGLAADIFKVALVRLDDRLRAEGMESRVVLQVHDEVILEVPAGEKKKAEQVVLDELRNAFKLNVPLEVNLSFGDTWADAKD